MSNLTLHGGIERALNIHAGNLSRYEGVTAVNKTAYRIGLLAAVGIVCASGAGVLNEEVPGVPEKTRWTWGSPTNGIVGGIYVNSRYFNSKASDHKIEYWVYVHEEFKVSADSSPPTFYFEPNSNALTEARFQKKFGDTNWAGTYFKATNYFCGPVVLRDSDGIELPPRDPGLVSLSAYPQSFRALQLGSLDATHGKPAVSLPGRLPQLAKFKLEDLFDIKKPGSYVLTVWPKIYRQLKNDADLCERVDLLPVSLKINWTNSPVMEVRTNGVR
jgi:hypothetical protein